MQLQEGILIPRFNYFQFVMMIIKIHKEFMLFMNIYYYMVNGQILFLMAIIRCVK